MAKSKKNRPAGKPGKQESPNQLGHKVEAGKAFDLGAAIKAKAGKATVAGIAKDIGVTVVSLKNVLAGRSRPNSRTAKAYAKYCGVAVALLQTPAGKASAASRKKQKRTSKKYGKSVKPGKRNGGGRGSAPRWAVALETISRELSTPVVGKVADPLAERVAKAPKNVRKLIAKILDLR